METNTYTHTQGNINFPRWEYTADLVCVVSKKCIFIPMASHRSFQIVSSPPPPPLCDMIQIFTFYQATGRPHKNKGRGKRQLQRNRTKIFRIRIQDFAYSDPGPTYCTSVLNGRPKNLRIFLSKLLPVHSSKLQNPQKLKLNLFFCKKLQVRPGSELPGFRLRKTKVYYTNLIQKYSFDF